MHDFCTNAHGHKEIANHNMYIHMAMECTIISNISVIDKVTMSAVKLLHNLLVKQHATNYATTTQTGMTKLQVSDYVHTTMIASAH